MKPMSLPLRRKRRIWKKEMIKTNTLLFIFSFLCLLFSNACHMEQEHKVGVMLPLSGDYFTDWKEPLEWAVENINSAGGAAGKPLRLVYRDTAEANLKEIVRDFIDDNSIKAVIGPATSREAMQVSRLFSGAKKPLITPSATSDEIFRAFAGNKYIWRTVESDIAQIKMLLIMAVQKGATKVSLICSDDHYGNTFFTWFGFFATELGIRVGAVVRYDHSVETECAGYVEKALEKSPDAVIVVPSTTQAAVCITREIKKRDQGVKTLFSDGGQLKELITELGTDAEGLEGTALSPDMSTGFETAYSIIFDRQPPPFAANLYDAVLLIAYGLEQSKGSQGQALADAMRKVVDGRGEKTGWDAQDIKKALSAIRAGKAPDITGTTGPLDYDARYYVDLISSNYCFWRIEAGRFVSYSFLSTGDFASPGTYKGFSIYQTLASDAAKQDLDFSDDTYQYDPPEKEGLWALILAGSSGWSNYRHQADALAQYSLLKDNGLTDDRIILIIEDDIAYNPSNSIPGVVRNVPDGPNLYTHNVEIDYKTSQLSVYDIIDILKGHESEHLPDVISSTDSDNILIFIVSHGGTKGIAVDAEGGTDYLTPQMMGDGFSEMYDKSSYRRIFMAVEACHGGVMGTMVDVPGVVVFASANEYENSLGANYDPALNAWLADQFSYLLYETALIDIELSLLDFYEYVYLRVNGSHVTVYNASFFGDMSQIKLEGFYLP